MTTTFATLRDRQVASLKKILNLNEDVPEEPEALTDGMPPAGSLVNREGKPIWKVLVFDDLGRDVISSVMRVSDLRAQGVTIHLHIGQSRHSIPDVPVVYLVEPTVGNLKAITNDLTRSLYSPAYLNFMSSLPRTLLEDFAADTAAANTSEHIAALYDQYLNFIVSEPDLFSLGMDKYHTYWAVNSAKTTDEQLDIIVDHIVSGLFSVVVTMSVIPIIRAPKGGAAEMIAQKLDRKLRDHILSGGRTGLGGSSSSSALPATQSRPVLLILDRNIDLTPMLSHSWTYQSLVHDVLTMKLNRITMESPIDETDLSKGTTKKTYDLTASDFFWSRNAGLPFPQVAEDIDAELSKYKEESAEITRKTGAASLDDLTNDAASSAAHLKAAMSALPELRERKAVLDMHMNILAAVLNGIKNRQLDNFFQMEEDIAKMNKAQMLDVIGAPDEGDDALDKLRLFIIWSLTTDADIARSEWPQFEDALQKAGVPDTSSLDFIRRFRTTTKMTQLTTVTGTGPGAPSGVAPAQSSLFGNLTSLSSRLTDRLKETGVPSNLTANLDSLTSVIKTFLPSNRDLTITKILESIMDPAAASSSALARTENYLYFDPRNAHARGTIPPLSTTARGALASSLSSSAIPGGIPGDPGASGGPTPSFGQRRQGFSEAIVFMVGGGSMDEYGNLREWAERTGAERGGGRRRVVYGSTEVVSAREFIREELERLGAERE